MVVSFHPRVHGDVNLRLPQKRLLSVEESQAVVSARAVILTQHVKSDQYRQLKALCPRVFPDYTHRFGFEGKHGNIRLFRKFSAPHPATHCYRSVDEFNARHFLNQVPLFPFPFVLKGDRGGGGWAVFLVRDADELHQRLAVLADTRLHPTKRFIAQVYVPHGGKDLRVVVVGRIIRTYWRCQERPDEFRNNVGRGAGIDYDFDPGLRQKGVVCVQDLCAKTGINLAAFDVLFDRSIPEPAPLLSEINFLFGRKGLGGTPRFHELLNDAVRNWTSGL